MVTEKSFFEDVAVEEVVEVRVEERVGHDVCDGVLVDEEVLEVVVDGKGVNVDIDVE